LRDRTGTPLLEVKNLVKHFPQKGGLAGRQNGVVRAVEDVSFSIEPGETLGLVGESGSGKSTTGRLILRLIEATSGNCRFNGKEVFQLSHSDLRALRRARLEKIPPYQALTELAAEYDLPVGTANQNSPGRDGR